jgi:hypothetical protein
MKIQRKSYNNYPILNHSEMMKKLSEECRDQLIKNIRSECSHAYNLKTKKYKNIAASVIHVEFDSDDK